MPEFWRACGYRLLAQNADGTLRVTDDFLRSLLARPELAPIDASGPRERALHDALVAAPRLDVAPSALAAVEDADARANYAVWLRFRDRLLGAPSLEAAYVDLFRGEGVDVAPLFVAQLTEIVLRHLLGDAADPLEARAAEMLFRPQKIAITDAQAVMAADAETVDRHAEGVVFGSLGELLVRQQTPIRSVDLDVLDAGNADAYFGRDEDRDFAIGLNRGAPAQAALCRVLERWIMHFTGVRVHVRPEREIDDARWRWHVGLDAEASGMLNDLFDGRDVDEARLARLLCLFRLDFADASDMLAQIAGFPVWLAIAMDERHVVKMKPQNLLMNLPLARPQ